MQITLDGQGSLQQQICRGLRQAIARGVITPLSKLTPSRVFAAEHGVSRNTVLAAYDQLVAEGYLQTKMGAGTFVAEFQPEPAITENEPVAHQPGWSETAIRLKEQVESGLLFRQPRQQHRYDFLYGEPSYQDLPLERWARLIGRSARELTEAQLGYGPVAGLPALREAIAAYLGRSRGVRCSAEQVFIVQGTQDAIDLTVRALIDPGDTAVLEEPRYRGFARALLAAGACIQSVAVDEEGLQGSALAKITGAKLAFVTPSHQFPFGSVMSLARRRQLLNWAKVNNTVVIEDDYDGEFRYEGRPIPSLQSLDEAGLVIYTGTASKILFPALRLGWMVVPKHMIDGFARLRNLSDSSGTVLEQLAFTKFVNEGFLERHIHKMRKTHSERRATLLKALAAELGDEVSVLGTQAGIHVLLRLHKVPRRYTDEIVSAAAALGVGVYSSLAYYSKPPAQAELLLGYASLNTREIRQGVKRLSQVIVKFS